MEQAWVWPIRPVGRGSRGVMCNFPSGVVTTEEPGRARNVRVPASKLTPGHPIRVSFRTARRQKEWSTFDYYCPTEEDRAILRRLELDPDTPPWLTVEARFVAAGFGPSELRELSGPALIRLWDRVVKGWTNTPQSGEKDIGEIETVDLSAAKPLGADTLTPGEGSSTVPPATTPEAGEELAKRERAGDVVTTEERSELPSAAKALSLPHTEGKRGGNELDDPGRSNNRRKPKNRTRSVSLAEAARECWFGKIDRRTLLKAVDDGVWAGEQISEKLWVFDLDDVYESARHKARPTASEGGQTADTIAHDKT